MISKQTMSKGKKRFLWTSAGSLLIVVAMLICSTSANGQSVDDALIMAMIESVEKILTGTITPNLTSISTGTGSMQSFQQTTLYPQSNITANQSMAASSVNTMTSMQSQFSNPVNSATTASAQALETQLLSGNANNVSSVGTSYYNVYGTLPASTALSSTIRTVVDMNDAQAQDGYKKAIQLDAMAKTEATLSQQYMQQLASTAPGNAALVEAQAAAWNLQAAAYTQQGLAELLRLQAAVTANQSFQIKNLSAQHQATMLHLGITSTTTTN